MLFVNARHIMVSTETEAQETLAKLLSGVNFGNLANSISKDTHSRSNGGELGWNLVLNYVKEFAEVVRNAPIEEIIGPIKTDFGYHIIQVHEREYREADEYQFNEAKRQHFELWLKETKDKALSDIHVALDWEKYVPREFEISAEIETELQQIDSLFPNWTI
jgi:parvulin-like peptidyl-prolyl isomerase